jgi:hypothetical protein
VKLLRTRRIDGLPCDSLPLIRSHGNHYIVSASFYQQKAVGEVRVKKDPRIHHRDPCPACPDFIARKEEAKNVHQIQNGPVATDDNTPNESASDLFHGRD